MNLSEKDCPVLKLKKKCSECPKAEQQWAIAQLLGDLAKQQTKPLTPTEQCWLLLLLQGLCPMQIAEQLNYRQNLRSEFSKSIYKYVAALTAKEKISDWAQVRLYLELAGYRKSPSPPDESSIEIHITITGNIDSESQNRILKELRLICGNDALSIERSYQKENR
jgi:hypothetical protein